MHISLPRDYERGPILQNDQEIFHDIMGPQKLDLSDIKMSGLSPPNLFQDFRSYVLKEILRIKYLLAYKGNNTSQVFSDVCALWEKILKFKDCLVENETALENEITGKLNLFNGKKSSYELKPGLEGVLRLIDKEFNSMIDEFFPIKGFAKVQFATREQAKRAIGLSVALIENYYEVKAVFDRGLPDYFYYSQLLAEIKLREKNHTKYQGKSKSEYELKLNHHFQNYSTNLKKKYSLKPNFLNNSQFSDPLISQVAKTTEEAQDVISSIEGIDNYGGKKREAKMKDFRTHSKIYKYSSDEEYYSETNPENKTPAFEKLSDERQEYTRKLAQEFLLFPEKIPTNKNEVNGMSVVPEMEFPKEFPPTRLWSSYGDKTKAYESILNYQQFFHESVPSGLKSDLNKLQKEKFGDYPNYRYVYEPEYDYQQVKKSSGQSKRNEMISKIRKKISNINQETPETSPVLNYVELGSEESKILSFTEDLRINTDSDEEEQKKAEISNLDEEKIGQKIKELKKSFSLMKRVPREVLAYNIDHSFTKTFRYEGEDVESYVKDLNQVPNFEAVHKKNDEGENIVHVTCTKKKVIDFDKVQKLFDKYGEMIINSQDEVEIDEEDLPLMETLKNFNNEPGELFCQLLADATQKSYSKLFDEHTSIEPIKLYGHMTPMVQEEEDQERFNSKMFGIQDIDVGK